MRYFSKRGYFFTTLKTESSERYILADDYLLCELRRWQNQQVANEKIFCPPTSTAAEKISLICTRDDGRLVLLRKVIITLRKENLNSHSFRHTHATRLIENGAAPKGVAGRLGHANTLITQNLYTHNTLKLQADTLAIFTENLQTK